MMSFRVKLDLAAIHSQYASGNATSYTVTSLHILSLASSGYLHSSTSLVAQVINSDRLRESCLRILSYMKTVSS